MISSPELYGLNRTIIELSDYSREDIDLNQRFSLPKLVHVENSKTKENNRTSIFTPTMVVDKQFAYLYDYSL